LIGYSSYIATAYTRIDQCGTRREVFRQKVFPSMESLDAERLAVIYALLDETQRAEEVVQRLPARSPDDYLAVEVHDVLYREGFLATFAHSG
jgi:hypothetical protein